MNVLVQAAYPIIVDTGQGYQRLQHCPGVRAEMSRILGLVQKQAGAWVGLSVVHLGDRDVPNGESCYYCWLLRCGAFCCAICVLYYSKPSPRMYFFLASLSCNSLSHTLRLYSLHRVTAASSGGHSLSLVRVAGVGQHRRAPAADPV